MSASDAQTTFTRARVEDFEAVSEGCVTAALAAFLGWSEEAVQRGGNVVGGTADRPVTPIGQDERDAMRRALTAAWAQIDERLLDIFEDGRAQGRHEAIYPPGTEVPSALF